MKDEWALQQETEYYLTDATERNFVFLGTGAKKPPVVKQTAFMVELFGFANCLFI